MFPSINPFIWSVEKAGYRMQSMMSTKIWFGCRSQKSVHFACNRQNNALSFSAHQRGYHRTQKTIGEYAYLSNCDCFAVVTSIWLMLGWLTQSGFRKRMDQVNFYVLTGKCMRWACALLSETVGFVCPYSSIVFHEKAQPSCHSIAVLLEKVII